MKRKIERVYMLRVRDKETHCDSERDSLLCKQRLKEKKKKFIQQVSWL